RASASAAPPTGGGWRTAAGRAEIERVSPPRAPDDDPQATRLQPRRRYELESVHAEGGMGRVWLARDNDLNRVVAVKEIKPDYPNGDRTPARFLREARVTGPLQPPGLVPGSALR